MKVGTATSPSTVVVGGVVTGVRLLVFMFFQRMLRAVMMAFYRIRLSSSGMNRSAQNRPAHRRHGPEIPRPHKAVCPGGYKKHDVEHRRKKKIAATIPAKTFLKLAPCKNSNMFYPYERPLSIQAVASPHQQGKYPGPLVPTHYYPFIKGYF